ncbi:DUF6717 family protein [Algoriphagus limi]|uniref:Uncharacterized protein n=1 Tax=Algoriphagus limi TaxID=2975273 RepID=A0ABT2G0T2_9BACT|nr:DUF6717 family protein [Algoriphagus limi]MCS5488878.1 hypothetical protein [Algoriphagus limi]
MSTIDKVFDLSVESLVITAQLFDMTNNEINVWLFWVIWPILTIWLIGWVVKLKYRLAKSKSNMKLKKHRFYKEGRTWYIDLPKFLTLGFGTKANLMMVGGADTYLDKISNNGIEKNIIFSDNPFDDFDDVLTRTGLGYDEEYLDSVGHAEVDGGAYYESLTKHKLWLCPVTKYVFGKDYPKRIFVKYLGI